MLKYVFIINVKELLIVQEKYKFRAIVSQFIRKIYFTLFLTCMGPFSAHIGILGNVSIWPLKNAAPPPSQSVIPESVQGRVKS